MFYSVLLKLCVINQLLTVISGYHFENCELAQILLQKHKLPANQLNDCKFKLSISLYRRPSLFAVLLFTLEPNPLLM